MHFDISKLHEHWKIFIKNEIFFQSGSNRSSKKDIVLMIIIVSTTVVIKILIISFYYFITKSIIQASMTWNVPNRLPEKKRKQARYLLHLHLSTDSVEIFGELNSRLLGKAFSFVKAALKELLSRMLSLHGIVMCFSLVLFSVQTAYCFLDENCGSETFSFCCHLYSTRFFLILRPNTKPRYDSIFLVSCLFVYNLYKRNETEFSYQLTEFCFIFQPCRFLVL